MTLVETMLLSEFFGDLGIPNALGMGVISDEHELRRCMQILRTYVVNMESENEDLKDELQEDQIEDRIEDRIDDLISECRDLQTRVQRLREDLGR